MAIRETLEFFLYDWLQVEAFSQRERFADHSRQTFDAVLDTCERIAREKYAPFNRLVDTEEPRTVTDPDGSLRVVLPQATRDAPTVIPESTMVAVLNRCDETREFMVQMWLQNPVLAKQGGAKVAQLLSPLQTSAVSF